MAKRQSTCELEGDAGVDGVFPCYTLYQFVAFVQDKNIEALFSEEIAIHVCLQILSTSSSKHIHLFLKLVRM